jgi:hypothetical protein
MVIKYLCPPSVNTPFISQILECIRSSGAKCLSSAALWGFRGCLDCTQLWHLEPLTMDKFGIKFKLDSRDIEPKLSWHKRECQMLASLSLMSSQILFTDLLQQSETKKMKQVSAHIAFTNKLSTLWHNKFIRLKHYLKVIPTQKWATN